MDETTCDGDAPFVFVVIFYNVPPSESKNRHLALWKRIIIIIIVISVIIGSLFGILIQTAQPPNQVYYFSASAIHTSSQVSCPGIVGNYTDWLEINVIGNRTGFNFERVSIFAPGSSIAVEVPLNLTAYVYFKPINSTFESLFVALPNYWTAGQSLDASVTFFISGFNSQTQDLVQIPLRLGTLSC